MRRYSVVVAMAAMLAGGCASEDAGPRQGVGALTGAVGGAFLGEKVGKGSGRVLATAAGAIAGAAVGSDIGRSLDRANAAHAAHASGRPTSHSQQTPVPGFAPPRAGGSRHYASSDRDGAPSGGPAVRDAQGCRALDEGGLRPSYACRNSLGQWFILQ